MQGGLLCVALRLSVWVCGTYVVHYLNGALIMSVQDFRFH